MREIAHFTGASITGISISPYQVNVGRKYNKEYGLDDHCKIVQGDFSKMPFEDEEFDVVFASESVEEES